MKYGIYNVRLSIGYVGACQEGEIDVTEEYEEEDWNKMSDDEQDEILTELMNELLGQCVEMSYWEKE